MTKPPFFDLSMRERQVMDLVHELGEATVSEVTERLGDAPSYDAVRMTLTVLRRKGYVESRRQGRSFVYRAKQRPDRVRRSALEYLLRTFFRGSASRVVSTLLGLDGVDLTEEELAEIEALVERKRRRNKRGSR